MRSKIRSYNRAAGITDETMIYHSPACGTSRKVPAALRDAGLRPRTIEYLKNLSTRVELKAILGRLDIRPRQILRRKGTPFDELKLGNPDILDDSLIGAFLLHPVLLERPIVSTPKG